MLSSFFIKPVTKNPMKNIFQISFVLISILFVLTGCNKEDTFSSDTLNDYYPLAVGKTYFYRLDSTNIAPFGTALIEKNFIAKDTVESTFIDNEGRLSYRIFRFVTDTAQTQPWQFASTYVATPTKQWIEYVDNNLRFVKMQIPITEGYSWKAHSFIDTKSLNTNVPYLDEWEYQYQDVGASYSVLNQTFTNTVTVLQQDETTPPGPFDPNNYQQRNYGVEVYAKGVGLVYKDFLHWTWQTTPPPSKYEDGSFGIRLRLISHN